MDENDKQIDEAVKMKGESWQQFAWAVTIVLVVGSATFAAGNPYKTLAFSATVVGLYLLCAWRHRRDCPDDAN
jgi:uncharacterized membrane protein HdeD (DUF308 family)